MTELTASLAKMKEQSKYLSEMLSVTFKELKNWTKEYGSKSDFEKISETAEKVYEIIAIESPDTVKDEKCERCNGSRFYFHEICGLCHGTGKREAK